MKNLTRIVTFMGYPSDWISENPRTILSQGSQVLTLPDKVRLFAVRRVIYDDSITPLYATSYPSEKRYRSLHELIKEQKISPLLLDAPILDIDRNLKVYTDDKVCAE
jgi:hypothetical protein